MVLQTVLSSMIKGQPAGPYLPIARLPRELVMGPNLSAVQLAPLVAKPASELA